MSGKTENERLYDVRVVERNIRKGVISRKDVDRYLKSLPDREENAQRMAELVDAGLGGGASGAGASGLGGGNSNSSADGTEDGFSSDPELD